MCKALQNARGSWETVLGAWGTKLRVAGCMSFYSFVDIAVVVLLAILLPLLASSSSSSLSLVVFVFTLRLVCWQGLLYILVGSMSDLVPRNPWRRVPLENQYTINLPA